MLDRTDPKAKRVAELWGNRDWRLNNAYYVQDEKGDKVRYTRRPAQAAYAANAWYFDLIPKARQLGFSTEIGIEMIDLAVFRRNTACGIIDYKLEDATKKLAKIKFAYHNLPTAIRSRVSLTKENEAELHFSNGSKIEVGTSHRGGTLQYLHVSEYGKVAADDPTRAKEIKTGGFQTVHAGQQIKVESTCHGTAGEFADMVTRARQRQETGAPLGQLEYRLHFYGWMWNPGYRLPVNSVVIDYDLGKYFEELKGKHGIKLDGEQMAWYAQKISDLGSDDMMEEFPSHIDECFFNSRAGTFFKTELSKARREQRIGQKVPHDPTRLVYTCWDIGIEKKNNLNAIWCFQTDGVRFRFIDYYENAGENVAHYARWVRERGQERNFNYGKHYGPHDLMQKVWANNAAETRTKRDIAHEAGIDFVIVPRVEAKSTSIEEARRLIGMSWFDEEHCKLGVERLENYRRVWNKALSQWTNDPLHDAASNGSDAFQTGAMAQIEDEGPRRRNSDRPKRGSQWAA